MDTFFPVRLPPKDPAVPVSVMKPTSRMRYRRPWFDPLIRACSLLFPFLFSLINPIMRASRVPALSPNLGNPQSTDSDTPFPRSFNP